MAVCVAAWVNADRRRVTSDDRESVARSSVRLAVFAIRPSAVRGRVVPSYASVVPSVSLSASICPLRSSESVVRSRTPSRAPPRASLRPDNASGEARAADRHGASPLVHPGSQPNDQPVFCRPAATPETVHRMR